MNNIDFKEIRNQFESIIEFFDDSKVSNQKIFSVVFNLDFKFKNILDEISAEYHPIFFSNQNFSAFSLFKEYDFSFSEFDDFKIKKNEIIELISSTTFINTNQNHSTFIFGGFNFNLNELNDGIWDTIPTGNFTLPRYTFLDSQLIINLFIENKATKLEIRQAINKYIDDLSLILLKQNVSNSKLEKSSNLTSRESYDDKVNNLLKILKEDNPELIKVVLSRIKKASFSDKVPLISIFKNLLSKNSESTNFLYTLEKRISIIGSTPELILSKLNSRIKSESIAGSNYRNKINNFKSDKKEIIEQKIVTDYIIDFLNKNAVDIKYNKKPQIKKSSNIEHLCTSFSAQLKNDKNIFDLLTELHPTPAIGGFPKKQAIDLIESRQENRGWYGGPIGWVDNNLNGQFFLNIRSGLSLGSDLFLFSGSGIIKESNCENEWMETEQKFNLMLSACNER